MSKSNIEGLEKYIKIKEPFANMRIENKSINKTGVVREKRRKKLAKEFFAS